MKNITLSIPENLLNKSRVYAKKNGTSINKMIREYLKNVVEGKGSSFEESLKNAQKNVSVKTKLMSFNRDELYER